MKVAAIVPAAGKGRRIKSKIDKPYIRLLGRPIIVHTLRRLSENTHIKEIVVAVRKDRIDTVRRFKIKKVKVIKGGKERRDSVYNALRKVSKDIDYILIHDGIRPFITDKLIDFSLRAAKRFGASVAAVPVKPTLKYIGKNGRVRYTPDRRRYWEAQTPQVFKRELIEKAYALVHKCTSAQAHKKMNITDDSMLVERLGIKPKIVLGSYSNIKITTREDLALARILYQGGIYARRHRL